MFELIISELTSIAEHDKGNHVNLRFNKFCSDVENF